MAATLHLSRFTRVFAIGSDDVSEKRGTLQTSKTATRTWCGHPVNRGPHCAYRYLNYMHNVLSQKVHRQTGRPQTPARRFHIGETEVWCLRGSAATESTTFGPGLVEILVCYSTTRCLPLRLFCFLPISGYHSNHTVYCCRIRIEPCLILCIPPYTTQYHSSQPRPAHVEAARPVMTCTTEMCMAMDPDTVLTVHR